MAIYTKTEYCKASGVNHAYLKKYIDRGKVIVTGNKIDTSFPENQTFLDERSEGEKSKIKAAEVIPVELDEDQKEKVRNLSLEQKKENLRKTTAEADKKELEAAKLRGEAVPVDLVRNIVSQLSQSFIMQFRDAAEGYMFEIAHAAKLKEKEIADLRGKLVESINGAMQTAVEIARKDLKSLAAEYSQNKQLKK